MQTRSTVAASSNIAVRKATTLPFYILKPAELDVLIKVAKDIALKLISLFRQGDDTVLFVGHSAGWIYDVWRNLGYHRFYNSQHLSISELSSIWSPILGPYYLNQEWEPQRDDTDGLYRNHIAPIFPQGFKGNIWIVDFTKPSNRGNCETSVDSLFRIFQHVHHKQKTKSTFQMELLRLVGSSQQGKPPYGKHLSPRDVPVAAEIVVPNPAGFVPTPQLRHFLAKLISNDLPRFCPFNPHKGRPDTPGQLRPWDTPRNELWKRHLSRYNPQIRDILACQSDIRQATLAYKRTSEYQQVLGRLRGQRGERSTVSSLLSMLWL